MSMSMSEPIWRRTATSVAASSRSNKTNFSPLRMPVTTSTAER
ncbi:Uncharacterised protein [Mycobacteroides abscessus subsp. abscessus]|nr:Uncharacterised protein [Mycobacteroides abscessus subsp. abscessus]